MCLIYHRQTENIQSDISADNRQTDKSTGKPIKSMLMPNKEIPSTHFRFHKFAIFFTMYGGGEGEEAGEVKEAGEREEAREGMPKNLIFSSDIMLPQIQLLNQGCAKKYNFYFFFNVIKVDKIIQISI